jgi:hypothetical protein
MPADLYRYQFDAAIPAEEVETTLVLSIFAVEALHGESQTRLDAGHALDPKKRAVVIDATTPVGRDLNRVFIGFVTREFGSGSFRVERVQQKPRPEPVTA